MPSPKSREAGFYYMHPQNRFWQVLAGVYEEPFPVTVEERRMFLTEHRIALWDVLKSCRISGASDASIREAEANDIPGLLKRTGIQRVFTTGTTAARCYRTLILPECGVPATVLPSPSSANARLRTDDLVKAYRVIRD